jgi:cell division protein FtsB
MEHITVERVALVLGQLQLSIINLQAQVEELEKENQELRKKVNN